MLKNCALFLAVQFLFSGTHSINDWVKKQTQYSKQQLLKNIGSQAGASPGAVVASPSKHDPNYFFHWIRDAALVFEAVRKLRLESSELSREDYLNDFIEFSEKNQLTSNPSGSFDSTGLGEPKFNVDGSAFTGPWGRPQNDGPALRALTLTRLALEKLDAGEEDWVRKNLYSSDIPASSVIKRDLEYTSHRWQQASFDPWEEVSGLNFYVLSSQRAALEQGAILARRLGDLGAADWYALQAQKIHYEMQSFWDAGRGIIVPLKNQNDGLSYKVSDLDISILLASIHSPSIDGNFGISDGRVLSTLVALEKAFQRTYLINTWKKDRQGHPLGTAMGRYPEDKYDGYHTSGRGNPWFLCTAAMAEHHYNLIEYWVKEKSMSLTYLHRNFLLHLDPTLQIGINETISQNDPRYEHILKILFEKAESFMNRIKFHVPQSGQMDEQFNQNTGVMQGAPDLTWSYASFLTAADARSRVMSIAQAQPE